MSSAATLVFPHQLFRRHPAIATGRPVFLVEEYLFFQQLRFHKKKILLHRASMKAFAASLQLATTVNYIDAVTPDSDIRVLLLRLRKEGIRELHVADPVDDWLDRRLRKSAAVTDISLHFYPSPNFLNSIEEGSAFFDKRMDGFGKARNPYFMAEFYISERKKRHWLMEDDGKPEGGKWSFDTDNRRRLPATQRLPFLPFPKKNKFVAEALQYVNRHFADHYGDPDMLPGGGFYPVTFAEADAWFDDFLTERFQGFGPYEDAMRASEHFLFHSVLTPILNIGLLDPAELIQKMLSVAKRKKIPLPSVEGFLRQVGGWREFVRILYQREGRRQRTRNFWTFTRKIPASLRSGTTGITPVDAVIRKVLATGYAHHIERLMVLGNFMLLCEIEPDGVYAFFMEMFVDAYDWVMVPNVYGMSQYADGGLMTTKPYLSASHYLLKMGDWERGAWEHTWDGLFWRFLSLHRSFFIGQPRWKMLIGQWDEMSGDRQRKHLFLAETFLKALDRPVAGDQATEDPKDDRNGMPALF